MNRVYALKGQLQKHWAVPIQGNFDFKNFVVLKRFQLLNILNKKYKIELNRFK
jgi:hypothetical protein